MKTYYIYDYEEAIKNTTSSEQLSKSLNIAISDQLWDLKESS